jgi:hypothetical protein
MPQEWVRGPGGGVVEWWLVGAGGGVCRAAGEHRWPIVAGEEAGTEEEGDGELSMVSPCFYEQVVKDHPECKNCPSWPGVGG